MQRQVLLMMVLVSLNATGARAQDAPAEEPAKILPAETGSFIQINNLADLRQSIANDPVLRHMLKMLPHERHHASWTRLQAALKLSGDQIVDRYFGSRLVIVGPRPGWNQPMTIMMRVQPDDSKRLITSLSLERMEKTGSFEVFSTRDDQTRFAVSQQWVSIARSGKNDEYMRSMLGRCGKGRALSEDPVYCDWMERLPKDRSATAFFRGHPTGHNAAVAVVNQRTHFSVHYVGRPPGQKRMFASMGDAEARQFGPLPRETVAAASINMLNRTPDDVEMLDRLLAPKTYEKDIAEKITAPLLLFVGELAGADHAGTLPAIGGAIRLRDAEVAKDLNLMIDNAMLVASVSAAKWGAPPIITQSGRHGDHRYRIAEVGVVLAKRFAHEELAQIRMSYGQVGDWYVVTSSEKFFNRCLDAAADEALQFVNDPELVDMPIAQTARSIATVMVRGKQTHALAERWLELMKSAPAIGPVTEAKMADAVETLPALFEQCKAMTAQFHRAEDDDELVVGAMHFVRQ